MIAVVTGGSRGVGQAIAGALREASFEVTSLSRSEGIDVTDRGAVQEALGSLEVDLLVNNAGSFDAIGPAWEVDPDSWRSDVETSLFGAFECSRAVLPGMVERGRGRIVNVSSGAGTRAYPYGSGYGAAKAAQISFTQSLARETGGHGISVFTITPGFVWTELTERLRAAPGLAPDIAAAKPQPPERAAELVVRLASGAYDALSGRLIYVTDDLDQMLNG